MHQDATWYGGRRQPMDFGLDGDSATLPKVRWRPGAEPPPIFGPCLLWPNGWMDEDGTWHGGRPQPRRLCVRWGPSLHSAKRGQSPPPQFSAHFYCGRTAGCIKMPFVMDVGLSPEDFVLDEDPLPLPKKAAEPPPQKKIIIIGPCLLWPNG